MDALINGPEGSLALEVQEFPPLAAYHPHTHHHPHLSLTHLLHVYPVSLKYDAQKSFAKVSLTCNLKSYSNDYFFTRVIDSPFYLCVLLNIHTMAINYSIPIHMFVLMRGPY